MNCDDIRIKLNGFVDRELKTGDHERIGNHVKQCPSCRQWADMMKRTRDTVRLKCAKGQAPERLTERIRNSLPREGKA